MVLDRKITKTCPNKDCPSYAKYFRGNIIKFGKQKNGTPRYKCTVCGKTFGTTKNTILFNKHITKDELVNICKLLAQKMSFRKISKQTNKHLDTIRNIADKIGTNYNKMKLYFREDLNLKDYEIRSMIAHLKIKKTKAEKRKRRAEISSTKHIHKIN